MASILMPALCCAANRPSQGVGRKIACRTRFFDDFLLDCSSSSPISLFVILGAGMDTRAWRLPLNGTVLEVDTPDVMAAKAALLRRHTTSNRSGGSRWEEGGRVPLCATGGRVGVAVDLGRPGWVEVVRGRAGRATWSEGQPMAVVMEGLTMYLNDTQVRQAGPRRQTGMPCSGGLKVCACVCAGGGPDAGRGVDRGAGQPGGHQPRRHQVGRWAPTHPPTTGESERAIK